MDDAAWGPGQQPFLLSDDSSTMPNLERFQMENPASAGYQIKRQQAMRATDTADQAAPPVAATSPNRQPTAGAAAMSAAASMGRFAASSPTRAASAAAAAAKAVEEVGLSRAVPTSGRSGAAQGRTAAPMVASRASSRRIQAVAAATGNEEPGAFPSSVCYTILA